MEGEKAGSVDMEQVRHWLGDEVGVDVLEQVAALRQMVWEVAGIVILIQVEIDEGGDDILEQVLALGLREGNEGGGIIPKQARAP